MSGFDFDELTRRLLGDNKLIPVLLRSFGKTFTDTGRELAALIGVGDYAAAAIMCHTVKGAAGNLSANALYHVAETLEKELKSGSAASLPQFEAALAEALEIAAEKAAV